MKTLLGVFIRQDLKFVSNFCIAHGAWCEPILDTGHWMLDVIRICSFFDLSRI